MRQITINLYSYAELSNDAKRNAEDETDDECLNDRYTEQFDVDGYFIQSN